MYVDNDLDKLIIVDSPCDIPAYVAFEKLNLPVIPMDRVRFSVAVSGFNSELKVFNSVASFD